MTLDLDPDRRLALAYVPAQRRPAIEALWRLDVTFGSVLATGSDPMMSRIRLAWWRESLEKLDRAPPPAEPLLEAVARQVLPTVSGAELAEMEQGWNRVLPPEPLTADILHAYAVDRGGRLFRYSARLLGGLEESVAAGGEAWALVDLARHSADEGDRHLALAAAAALKVPPTWSKPLRPLGMLAMLARRDVERKAWESPGAPGRMFRMMRHRLTGH